MTHADTPVSRARLEPLALHPIHAEAARFLQPSPRARAVAYGGPAAATALTPQLIHRLAVEGLLP